MTGRLVANVNSSTQRKPGSFQHIGVVKIAQCFQHMLWASLLCVISRKAVKQAQRMRYYTCCILCGLLQSMCLITQPPYINLVSIVHGMSAAVQFAPATPARCFSNTSRRRRTLLRSSATSTDALLHTSLQCRVCTDAMPCACLSCIMGRHEGTDAANQKCAHVLP